MNEPTNEYTDNTTITTITQQTNGGKRAHIQRGKEKSAVQKLAVLMLFVVFFLAIYENRFVISDRTEAIWSMYLCLCVYLSNIFVCYCFHMEFFSLLRFV